MATRRSRIQVKPNLGPRLSRSQIPGEGSAAAAKEKSQSSSGSGSVSDVLENTGQTFTQLKEIHSSAAGKIIPSRSDVQKTSGYKTPEKLGSLVVNEPKDSAVGTISQRVSDTGGLNKAEQGESVPAGTITRSPKKAPSVETKTSDPAEASKETSQDNPLTRQQEDSSAQANESCSSCSVASSPLRLKSAVLPGSRLTNIRGAKFKPRPNLVDGSKSARRLTEAQKSGAEGGASDHNHDQNQTVKFSEPENTATTSEHRHQTRTSSKEGSPSMEESCKVYPMGKTDRQSSDIKRARCEAEASVSDAAGDSQTSCEQEGEIAEEFVTVRPLSGKQEVKKRVSEKKTKRPKVPSTDTPPDRTTMKMSDLIFWNPSRNPMKKKDSRASKPSTIKSLVEPPTADVVDGELSNQSNSLPVPQVKIGADGNIILNTDSLVVNNPAAEPIPSGDLVEEDEDHFINCSSFRDYKRPKLWTENETRRFFKALSVVGTDFSLMCSIFPSRSRRELKNKFKKEERQNRPLIDKALRERQSFDMQTFESAKAEDEEEKRRCEAAKEEKHKKCKMKKEKEEEEEEEELEMEEEYRDPKKENKKSSAVKRIGPGAGDESFSGYVRKRRRVQPSAGHTKEVADILVNMSRGKAPHSNDDDGVSIISSDGDLLVEPTDEAFVPQVARRGIKSQSNHSSITTTNIIVDSHVHMPEMVPSIYTDSLHPLEEVEKASQAQNHTETSSMQPTVSASATPQEQMASLSQATAQQSMSVGDRDLYDMVVPHEVMQMMEKQHADLILMENQATGEVVFYMVPRQTTDAALSGEMSLHPSHIVGAQGLQQSLVIGQSQVLGQGAGLPDVLPGTSSQVAGGCGLQKATTSATTFCSVLTSSPTVVQNKQNGSRSPVVGNRLDVCLSDFVKLKKEETPNSKFQAEPVLVLEERLTKVCSEMTVNEYKTECQNSSGSCTLEQTFPSQKEKTCHVVSGSSCQADSQSKLSQVEAHTVPNKEEVWMGRERTLEVGRTSSEDLQEDHNLRKHTSWHRPCTEFPHIKNA